MTTTSGLRLSPTSPRRRKTPGKAQNADKAQDAHKTHDAEKTRSAKKAHDAKEAHDAPSKGGEETASEDIPKTRASWPNVAKRKKLTTKEPTRLMPNPGSTSARACKQRHKASLPELVSSHSKGIT